jgi:hypothetical protein
MLMAGRKLAVIKVREDRLASASIFEPQARQNGV